MGSFEERFPLRPPRANLFVVVLAIAGGVISSLALLASMAALQERLEDRREGWFLAALLYAVTIYMWWVAIPRFRLMRGMPPVILYADHLILPPHGATSRTISLFYGEIEALELSGRPGNRKLSFSTGAKSMVISEYQLGGKDAFDRLVELLRERVCAHPNGGELLGRIERGAAASAMMRRRSPRAALALLLLSIAGFGVQLLAGDVGRMRNQLIAGANATALVERGDWYRLISGCFIYSSWTSFVLGVAAFGWLAFALEKLIGAGRLLVVFLGAAIASGLVSHVLGGSIVWLGSAGPLFGLFGCMTWLQIRHRRILPPTFRRSMGWWVVATALLIGSALAVDELDGAALSAGLLAGAMAIDLMMLAIDREAGLAARPNRVVLAVAGVFFAVTVASLAQAAIHAGSPEQDLDVYVIEHLARSKNPDPRVLNNLAWELATERGSTPRRREAARFAAERAEKLDPDAPHIKDTLATAYYMLGDLDGAIALERKALRSKLRPRDEFFTSQLARFELARVRRDGPMFKSDVRAWVKIEETDRSAAGLSLVLDRPFEDGGTVHAIVLAGGEIAGHVGVEVPKGATRGQFRDAACPCSQWTGDHEVVIALIEPGNVKLDVPSWTVLGHSDRVKNLPKYDEP
jgi:membrane associated rhomboid family serine protease